MPRKYRVPRPVASSGGEDNANKPRKQSSHSSNGSGLRHPLTRLQDLLEREKSGSSGGSSRSDGRKGNPLPNSIITDLGRVGKVTKGISSGDVYEDMNADLPSSPDEEGQRLMDTISCEFNSNMGDADSEVDEEEAFDALDDDQWGHHFTANPASIMCDGEDIGLRKDMVDASEEDPDAIDVSDMLSKPNSAENPVSNARTPVPQWNPNDWMVLDEEEDEEVYPDFYDEDDGAVREGEGSGVESINRLQNLTQMAIQSFTSTQDRISKSSNNLSSTFDALVYPEGEFTAPISGDGTQLSIETLLEGLGPDHLFGDLRKQIVGMGKEKKCQKSISSPLPPTARVRLERQAAYQVTSKEISQWNDIVQRNRKAEHLEFPLNRPQKNLVTKGALAGRPLEGGTSAPDSMTADIQDILKNANMSTENEILAAEELAFNSISEREVKAQRAELAKFRALLFYGELKEKRAAKIKSKKFRRIRKKKKEKARLSVDQLESVDADLADEERLKMETKRAKERVSLRHKNGGKWGRDALKFHEQDHETRLAVIEKLDRHEQLMKHIQGHGSDSDGSEMEGGEYSDADEHYSQVLKSLEKELETAPVAEKGLLAMKFMKNAIQSQAAAARERIKEIQREFETDSLNEEAEQKLVDQGSILHDNPGRIKFSPEECTDDIVKVGSPMKLGVKGTDNSITKCTVSDFSPGPLNLVVKETVDQSEGWDCRLDAAEELAPLPLLPTHSYANSAQFKSAKTKLKLVKTANKKKHAEMSPAHDFLGEVEVRHVSVPKSLEEVNEVGLPDQDHSISFLSQRELVHLAFSTDNVLEKDFEEEKKRDIENDAPKEVDITLPGWGSWSGATMNERPSIRKFIVVQKADAVDPSRRQDKRLKHVIINEKKDKKFLENYQVSQVPFPFQSRDQFEAMTRQPIGPQWSTSRTFSDNIKPRIIVPRGLVVNPLKK